MAYSELIKNFNRIREYMRDFYVYGFKNRDEFTQKSARSYDDERRRLESWLGDYMKFHHTVDGKNIFLSIDSRVSRHNPLYNAWKTKSFTDGDITLHFIIMDILADAEEPISLNQIAGKIDEYLSSFNHPRVFDESTVRKKLKEYISEGIVVGEKLGKTMYYSLADSHIEIDYNALDFFSEVSPCGVIGSYLLDREIEHKGIFAFKHHYITSTMDSEILYYIFMAMREHRNIRIETINRDNSKIRDAQVVPLRIMISVQNGRQYLMAFSPRSNRMKSFRLDNIVSVKMEDINESFESLREKLDHMSSYMWGVSAQSRSGKRMEHVEFVVQYADDEKYI
ncbi:MAG: WYL domain-containing transcriptional regulator, partial [Anaerotignum sp.]|nr:WYL domain-containing transcriptional regulator [Anaerotignum sp.]